MKSTIRHAVPAAAAVLILGFTTVRAQSLEKSFAEASTRVSETKAAAKEAASKQGEPTVTGRRIGYKASLKTLLTGHKCATDFRQVNGREPLATCDIDAGAPGVIKPVAMLPFGLHAEFDSELGDGSKVGCTGGIRGDAGLAGRFQVFVNLSPFSSLYSKAQFQECFESVIAKLQAKDRVIYFESQ